MPDQDPRAVLGLPLDATRGEAQRAYRRLAKQTHPDAGGDPAAFRTVASAWADLVAVLPADPAPTVDLRTAPPADLDLAADLGLAAGLEPTPAAAPFRATLSSARRPGGSPYSNAARSPASRVVWSEFRPPAAPLRVRRNRPADRDFAAVLEAEVARLAS